MFEAIDHDLTETENLKFPSFSTNDSEEELLGLEVIANDSPINDDNAFDSIEAGSRQAVLPTPLSIKYYIPDSGQQFRNKTSIYQNNRPK